MLGYRDSLCTSLLLGALLGACTALPGAGEDDGPGGKGDDLGESRDDDAVAAPACTAERCVGASCDDVAASAEIMPIDALPRRNAPKTVVPEPPLVTRSVRLGGKVGEYMRPNIPAWRTTPDGRVALMRDGGQTVITALQVERLRGRPLSQAPADIAERIFGQRRAAIPDVVHDSLPSGSKAVGRFLCQPNLRQPSRCAQNPDDDCYRVNLMQLVDVSPDGPGLVMQRIPLTVRVDKPKTLAAEVAHVAVAPQSSWELSPRLPIDNIFEPLATADGRLFVGRLDQDAEGGAGGTFTYRLDDGSTNRAHFSLFYAYSDQACGVDGWFAHGGGVLESIRPWPAAHFDSRLRRQNGEPRYGFAAYPVRDPLGTVLGEKDVLSGSYPWVDREGNNIFFSATNARALSAGEGPYSTRYPLRREDGALQFPGSPPRGFSVIGSWTHGKAVMIDNLITNTDYAFAADDTHVLQLYATDEGPVGVRVNGGSRDGLGALKLANVKGNGHHIESLQNAVGYHLAGLPWTVRDVVWNVTRGLASDEIAFDDYLDPHVLVFAEMAAAWRNRSSGGRAGRYLDGFRLEDGVYVHAPKAIRVQNGATSPVYPIPEAGRLVGDGRIEPVALGGVRGRGLWLEPQSSLRFDLPAAIADAVGETSFYAGVFVDARDDLSGRRHLLTVPTADGGSASLLLTADGGLATVRHAGEERSLDVSCAVGSWSRQWHHIGALFAGKRVTVFVDGNPVGQLELAEPVHLGGGELGFGGELGDDPGVRGWYDEARLVVEGGVGQLSRQASVELLCNYARGTVAAVGADSPLRERAEAATAAHERAAGFGVAVPDGAVPWCVTAHERELGIGRELPAGAASLRHAILDEGGPALSASAPRPDTTGNSFCRSCHVPGMVDPDRPLALQPAALEAGTVVAPLDPRTQPMQPPSWGDQPATVHGNIPANWIRRPSKWPAERQSGPVPVLERMLAP